MSRDRTIAQFHHTAWTAKDGAPSQITALAQTTDSYLWIGTARGIFRFDGVRFERYTPPNGVTLPSQNIYTLMATPDGGLWISFRSRGLGFLRDGRLTIFNQPDLIPRSWVYSFAIDGDGRLWAGTFEGLALRSGSRWLEVGASEWGVERGRVWHMIVDRAGTLWAAIGRKLWILRRGSRTFENAGTFPISVIRIAQSNDGAIWINDSAGSTRPLPAAPNVGLGWNLQSMLFDRDGTLWVTASPFGLRRLRFPERATSQLVGVNDSSLDLYRERDGLSSDLSTLLLEDREGNIWVG
ncbi:MAG: ligand-binding sensor domain-containing protein, partial [Thermoanaerobaculia bacterium]